MNKTLRTLTALAGFMASTALLVACTGTSTPEQAVFRPGAYEQSTGVSAVADISIYKLPAVDLEGSLQTAFNQAVVNSQFMAEQVGLVERTDFRDGEFMTFVYDPNQTETTGGFWYLKMDGTSSYGYVKTPLINDNEAFELVVSQLALVNDFVDREFDTKDEKTLTINFGGYYLYEYLIEENVITQITVVDSTNPDLSAITYMEYGNVAKISGLSAQLDAQLAPQS